MLPANLEQDLGTAQDADKEEFTFGDLLKEAMAHKADTVKLKDGRKALKDKTPMASAEYEQMLADIKRIEVAREWLPRAAVAMFQVQHCLGCENYAPFFTGLFQRQKNRHLREADRWIAATESENYGLPKEIKTNEVDVPFCSFCVGEFGFPVEQLGVVFDEMTDAETEELEEELDADCEGDEATDEDLAEAEFEAAQDELAYNSLDNQPTAG